MNYSTVLYGHGCTFTILQKFEYVTVLPQYRTLPTLCHSSTGHSQHSVTAVQDAADTVS